MAGPLSKADRPSDGETVSPSFDGIATVDAEGDDEVGTEGARNEVDEPSERMRGMRRLQDPKLPSAAEVDAHAKTHLPFRAWCRFCVAGRG